MIRLGVLILCLYAGSIQAQQLSMYRYWFDTNFSNATSISSSNEIISITSNTNNLNSGIHSLNFQSKDNNGNWSSIITSYFIRSVQASLSEYRYWFDNDFANAISVSNADETIPLALSLNSLSNGPHVLNFQVKDGANNWSNVIPSYFIRSVKPDLTEFRYWFDNGFNTSKTLYIRVDSSNDFVAMIDLDNLNNGLHQLNYQFKDKENQWTSVYTDTINKGNILYRIYIEPKVYISSATLVPGDIQSITGSDFTNNGTINLNIETSTGDILPVNNSFTYLPNGKFSYTLPIISSMPDGEYKVYASDINTGVISPVLKFRVNNPVSNKLWITEPIANTNYNISTPTSIIWKDYVTKTNAIGISGYVSKSYKIEYSNDNGQSWQTINSNYSHLASNNQINQFTTTHIFLQPGNYLIRVTDLENVLNTNTSGSFTLPAPGSNNFSYSLEWDHSISTQNLIAHPLGLAADGTSRIFIKLNRESGNSPVMSITASISSQSGSGFQGTTLLGRILPVKNHDQYNLEANYAISTSCDTTFSGYSSSSNYWFWLVAPDDFTQELNNQDAERLIKVTFTITYSDNSTSQLTTNQIRIVRPPLMLVHGLNSNSSAFDNMKYNVDGTTKYFIYAGGQDGLFKRLVAVNLKNYASFTDNAEILLGIGDLAYRSNSFQRILKGLHEQGFAANRLDYVCHSMGGSVARTVINKFSSYYNPDITQTGLIYKNYGKGFINKLITINTPHNGSPIADLVTDIADGGDNLFLNLTVGGVNNFTNFLDGFFVKQNGNRYDASPAIKDLRAVNGGIRFNTTYVKNHLIGGDIDRYNVPDAYLLAKMNADLKTGVIINLITKLLPESTLEADASIDLLNAYISLQYGYPNYLSNSDLIVPVSSQFPGLNENDIPEVENQSSESIATNSFGLSRNHMSITDDLYIGTLVMHLLNAQVNSGYFANSIPGNTIGNGTDTYREGNIYSTLDSVHSYIDTGFIKIVSPTSSQTVFTDSTINIQLELKDTTGFNKIQLSFQGENYESYSSVSDQTFNIKVHSNSIGRDIVIADALYDSAGFTIYHIDTIYLKVESLDTLRGIIVNPKTQNLNKEHIFRITPNAVFNNYVGVLMSNADSLSFQIADTNVVVYNEDMVAFVTKDTGTTYIKFDYKGFTDTSFIYVSDPKINVAALPVSLISFNGYVRPLYNLLEWKTASEINFSHFVLQRSIDGTSWSELKTIPANSNTLSNIKNYQYQDSAISLKRTFYRLKMTDQDGSYTFSSIIMLNRNSDSPEISVFPNPINNSEVFIYLNSSSLPNSLRLSLSDLTGKIVLVKTVSPIQNSPVKLDLHGMKPSVYVLKIEQPGSVQSIKLVIMN